MEGKAVWTSGPRGSCTSTFSNVSFKLMLQDKEVGLYVQDAPFAISKYNVYYKVPVFL